MPTPLRYPGGKQRIWRAVAELIRCNVGGDCEYVEPFCGGAGIAIELLNRKIVHKIHINDVNPLIYNFWNCVKNSPESLCRLMRDTPITVESWDKQKQILKRKSPNEIELAFAFLFLNRTSFSGIINGGVIGGRKQEGRYKIDARYPVARLISNIEEISENAECINVSCMDAKEFIRKRIKKIKNAFVYCDPPYYVKGRQLYMDYYKHENHVEIAKALTKMKEVRWIVSYDNVEAIRLMYDAFKQVPFDMAYCARNHQVGSEILICSDSIELPEQLF